MSDVKTIKVDNEEYVIKDETARNFLISDNNKNFQFAYSAEKEKYGFKVDGEFHPFENPYLRFNEDTGYIQALNTDGEWTDIYNTDELPINAAPVGAVYSFAYTGNAQTWTSPATALYKFEVYGAGVTNSSKNTLKTAGGYACGYMVIKKDTKLYIYCGGTSSGLTGGYNGGANSPNMSGVSIYANGGAGATHIATMSSLLKDFASADRDKILIVAGGSSGNAYNGYNGTTANGGATGGGSTGGGNAFGEGANPGSNWGYSAGWNCGGGGGWSGGSVNKGGTGYISNIPAVTYKKQVYSPSMTQGGGTFTNGKAIITCIA